eukprot:CAMPEP_0118846248 /NCGR_PEP_ID=MMETSP1162-20130426/91815_1 /TAXON_ID=33656 /ORGANISM="Phaeocystis Sp, Strain CCMP2710" /LENGTH=63 /DNA_ID=CAMNT_0006778425 /DNA_START=1 /DNA_END=192 /DNA_ORIENTATION=+
MAERAQLAHEIKRLAPGENALKELWNAKPHRLLVQLHKSQPVLEINQSVAGKLWLAAVLLVLI